VIGYEAMRFYVPAAKSPEKSENVYQDARKRHNAIETEKRIRSITYRDMNTRGMIRATVGKSIEHGIGNVMVILESDSNYLVCTWSSGLQHDGQEPIIVPKINVSEVKYFDS
jgi:hypothetical protein